MEPQRTREQKEKVTGWEEKTSGRESMTRRYRQGLMEWSDTHTHTHTHTVTHTHIST